MESVSPIKKNMVKCNLQKHLSAHSSLRSTRNTLGVGVPGHLVKNELQDSRLLTEQTRPVVRELLEEKVVYLSQICRSLKQRNNDLLLYYKSSPTTRRKM